MLWIIVGVIAAFNWLIVIKKVQMERHMDAILDIGFMVAFTWLFGNTGQGGMVVAMIASGVVSVALLNNPLDFGQNDEEEDEIDTLFPTGAANGSN